MPDTKISAGADPGSVVATDKVPMARSASTTAYAATMAELATFANTAYTPNYYTGSPSMDGAASAGSVAFVSRGDHVHPSDTARVAKAGDTMAGFLTLNANPTANLHAATKQYVDGSAPVGGPYVAIANLHDVGRNLLHNPLFNVAQRGAGPFSVNGSYSLDRWGITYNLDAFSIGPAPLADTHRAQIGDEQAASCLNVNFTGNAGAAAYSATYQPIENVRRLAGKTVTVSFWAVATATPKLGVGLAQLFGSGGSPSATVALNGQSVTLSTTFARYSLTFAVPSASGKTFGSTAGTDYTQITFYFSSGTTNATAAGNPGVQSGVVSIWGVQLEVGSVATPLEKPDPRYDLSNCQRFYSIAGVYAVMIATAAGQAVGGTLSFPTTMRAPPTTTFTSTGNINVGAVTATGLAPADRTSFLYFASSSAAGQAQIQGTITASADL